MSATNATNTAIVLTGAEPAAIAVVRIAGPGVSEFLQRRFSERLPPMRATHGELRDGERVIDDPVIVLHEGGLRADINLHGGAWVVQACLDLLRQDGFVIAQLDDASLMLDGDDIFEREMLAHLSCAKTELALRALLAQPTLWRQWLESTHSSAEIERVLSDRALHWMLHPPTVAIVGAANVGKSTIANQLFAQQRSVTADVPGTTRDWVGELANVDGLIVTLIDTPGIRQTDDPIEQAALERAGQPVRVADLIILVLDVSRAMDEQAEVLARFGDSMKVANKCDLPTVWNATDVTEIQLIAHRGEQIDRLRGAIRYHFLGAKPDEPRVLNWTARQRELLQRIKS